jgi:ADP-dependent NAD(P)H-hydrate dehydratase / NAD(P)H-hydrate epimerase
MSIESVSFQQSLPLFNTAATRRIEEAAAHALPPHTLMQRAGLSVAKLACALAPHARVIWVACGPGNNGGDGLEAAMHLRMWGRSVVVSWLGDEATGSPDALASLARARDAGVEITQHRPAAWDMAIDALLGIGASRAPQGEMLEWLQAMRSSPAPVLCVDVPSGLQADTGCWLPPSEPVDTIKSIANYSIYTGASGHFTSPIHTLSLLTLKPGLWTAHGRDACGELWFDDLGIHHGDAVPTAWLTGRDQIAATGTTAARPHASHKGNFGDVAVIGGAAGMQGAALLAARAALHAGAGRVLVALLDGQSFSVDVQQPELMFRDASSLDLRHMTVVCGCGGGQAVRQLLPRVLSTAPRLVLDADALNAVAQDASLQSLLSARSARQQLTILTPHPLEAARLLGSSTAQVQSHRLSAAQSMADRCAATVILKGSGSIIASPGQVPAINPTGNARLASAGTGDVLAGLCGARLVHADSPEAVHQAAISSCFSHGQSADQWPTDQALTASALAACTCR